MNRCAPGPIRRRATPSAPYALELAEYAVKVRPESARVVQTLRLTLYGDHWQTVPLGDAGSFISADFKGTEGRVEAGDKGLEMHVRGHGRREVRLESAVPVARDDKATRPTWSFALRFPAAAVVRGRIEAPPAVEEIDPEGSGLVRPAPSGGWSFVALPSTEVRWTLSGKAAVPRRAQLPLRFEATPGLVSRPSSLPHREEGTGKAVFSSVRSDGSVGADR
ncbi:MAG TPA: hypothetical protein VFR03_09900 [Thermoanaerobaculia bacterium]|nr:hypothetical protein [Thermoanaerobaculia bacterium]